MIEEELGEEVDGVIRLSLVGLREGLGKDEANLVLLKVGDVRVLLVQNRLLLLRRCHFLTKWKELLFKLLFLFSFS